MEKLPLAGKDAEVLKALPKIPLGVSHWDMLTDGNFLIVDKTAKIADLVACPLVFFARPRRMGKSTLCSMLEELFTHGTSRFAGTKIYDLWPEDKDRTYPVIRLSFNEIAGEDLSKFEQSLKSALINTFSDAGFPEVNSFQQRNTLIGFLHQFDQIAKKHKLVFLIDEWDSPLSNNLDKEDAFKVAKGVLRDFYSWLCGVPNLRFVLVTGIMRYRENSLLSGQQDIQDLSMDPDFADLLGYTQDDIEHAFAKYIPLACERLHLTKDELFERLRVHYDGFCFDENASVKVYCPYAINKFFSLVKSPTDVPYFGSFWMESADARLALISYLREHTLEAAELEQICQQRFTLSYQEITEANCFGKVKFKQLLVHAGYFSILSIAGNELDSDDEPEPPEKRKFTCGITNKDVEDVFVPVLTQYLLGFDEQKLSELEVANAAARQNLLQGNIEQMCMQLNQGLCKVGDSILHDAKEGVYAFFLEQALRSKKLATARAKVNNLGHSGFVAETQDRIYVFELKHLRKATATQADQHSLLEDVRCQTFF